MKLLEEQRVLARELKKLATKAMMGEPWSSAEGLRAQTIIHNLRLHSFEARVERSLSLKDDNNG